MHIFDALFLGETDVRQFHFMERLEKARKFVRAINRSTRIDLAQIRVKEPIRLEQIESVFHWSTNETNQRRRRWSNTASLSMQQRRSGAKHLSDWTSFHSNRRSSVDDGMESVQTTEVLFPHADKNSIFRNTERRYRELHRKSEEPIGMALGRIVERTIIRIC